MRLLQAVADGRLGGGTTHVLQLIETIKEELPVEVHLVAQQHSPALVEAEHRGAVVHGIDFFRSRLDPRVWLRLRRLIADLRPDLIHAHGARAGLPMTRAAGDVPMFYSVRGYHFSHKPPLVRRLAIAAERRCHARADLTLFVADHDRTLAERVGLLTHCRSHQVIKNSLQLDRLPEAEGSGTGRVIGSLGRLVPQKAPLFLLDVLDRLRDDGFTLRIIGDGELMPAMRRRAEELGLSGLVDYQGALPRDQALRSLAGTDMMLLPSLWEGFPHTALEALAMGVPVIAHPVGGVPEIVEHGRSGFLLDRLDPVRWAEIVREVATRPGLRAALVDHGRRAMAQNFSWATNRQTYLDLYRAVLSAPRPEPRERPTEATS